MCVRVFASVVLCVRVYVCVCLYVSLPVQRELFKGLTLTEAAANMHVVELYLLIIRNAGMFCLSAAVFGQLSLALSNNSTLSLFLSLCLTLPFFPPLLFCVHFRSPSCCAANKANNFQRTHNGFLPLLPAKRSKLCVCVLMCECVYFLKNHLQVPSEIAVSKSWRQSQLSEQQMLARGKSIRPKNLLAHVVGQIFCWPRQTEL